MFEIVKVVIYGSDVLYLNEKEYEVNDGILKLCRKIFRIYTISIGILCVVGINLADLLGLNTIIGEVLIVLILLILFNYLMKYSTYRILLKKVVK